MWLEHAGGHQVVRRDRGEQVPAGEGVLAGQGDLVAHPPCPVQEAVGLTKVVPFLLEDALKASGGVYSKAAENFGAHVAVGKNLVTGQNPASTKGVAEGVVRLLRDKR